MAVVVGKTWHAGDTLTVGFLDGEPEVQRIVGKVAAAWLDGVNLSLEFGDDLEADIRITFSQPGSWSYVGTDARNLAGDRPTMNFGWLTPGLSDTEYRRVVLHEFGHALGAVHEHQNPAVNIPWNKEAVYQHYAKAPNYWDRQTVDVNLFQAYQTERTNHTKFDPQSIMLYPIPNELTVGDYMVDWNDTLSILDLQLMATQYPSDPAQPKQVTVGGASVKGKIGSHGEVDEYQFEVDRPGKYLIETNGDTDVVMAVFSSNDANRKLGTDDDSGQDRNALLELDLDPGVYEIRIWHYWPRGTGGYRLTAAEV